jgi:ubiquitin-protein ligase
MNSKMKNGILKCGCSSSFSEKVLFVQLFVFAFEEKCFLPFSMDTQNNSSLLKMASKTALTRVQRDLQLLSEVGSAPYSATASDDNLFSWEVMVSGPENSPYHGGIFMLEFNFPPTYPFSPPKVKFLTKIYHCNVNNKGEICLEILKEGWSPLLNAAKILDEIYSLLSCANAEHPLEAEIGQIYRENRDDHDRIAREWTERYAT